MINNINCKFIYNPYNLIIYYLINFFIFIISIIQLLQKEKLELKLVMKYIIMIRKINKVKIKLIIKFVKN